MRALVTSGLLLAAVGAASVVAPTAGVAREYPWCAHYGNRDGGTNCGFVSYRQCMAALSGNGGYCAVNRFFPGPAERSPARAAYPYRS